MTQEREPIRRRADGSVDVEHYSDRANAARSRTQREALRRVLGWWRMPRREELAAQVEN